VNLCGDCPEAVHADIAPVLAPYSCGRSQTLLSPKTGNRNDDVALQLLTEGAKCLGFKGLCYKALLAQSAVRIHGRGASTL